MGTTHLLGLSKLGFGETNSILANVKIENRIIKRGTLNIFHPFKKSVLPKSSQSKKTERGFFNV
jgi:hypothetical protein